MRRPLAARLAPRSAAHGRLLLSVVYRPASAKRRQAHHVCRRLAAGAAGAALARRGGRRWMPRPFERDRAAGAKGAGGKPPAAALLCPTGPSGAAGFRATRHTAAELFAGGPAAETALHVRADDGGCGGAMAPRSAAGADGASGMPPVAALLCPAGASGAA